MTEDEIVSDAFPIKLVDEIVYEIDSQQVLVKEGGVNTGANPSNVDLTPCSSPPICYAPQASTGAMASRSVADEHFANLGADEESVYNFLTDHTEHTSLRNAKSNTPVVIPLTRTPSSLSNGTVVQNIGAMEFSVCELCEFIQQHRSLQQAIITMTEGYKEHSAGVIHRFLLLGLEREDKKPIWLRLDRRLGKGVSTIFFLLKSSVTRANDTAQLAATKHRLTESAQLENQQAFRMPPTLAELRHLLLVTSEVLRTYKLWRENCWFFVSLLQQLLGETNGGHFIHGSLMWGTLAQGAREKVRARLQLGERSPEIPRSRPLPLHFVQHPPISHGLLIQPLPTAPSVQTVMLNARRNANAAASPVPYTAVPTPSDISADRQLQAQGRGVVPRRKCQDFFAAFKLLFSPPVPCDLGRFCVPPIVFTDAMGLNRSVPFRFFATYERFVGYITSQFRDNPGRALIDNGNYALTDGSGNTIRKSVWTIRPGSKVDMSVVILRSALGVGYSCLRCRRQMSPHSLNCAWCDMSIRELDREQWEANTNADINHDAEDNAASDEASYQNTRAKKIERVNEARLKAVELAKYFKRIAVVGELRQRDTLAEAERWDDVIEHVRDNLTAFAMLRGGRVRASSFVGQSRRTAASRAGTQLSPLLTMTPTLVATMIGPEWMPQKGDLADPASQDPSRSSAAL